MVKQTEIKVFHKHLKRIFNGENDVIKEYVNPFAVIHTSRIYNSDIRKLILLCLYYHVSLQIGVNDEIMDKIEIRIYRNPV